MDILPTYPNLAKLLAQTFGGANENDFAKEYGKGDIDAAVLGFASYGSNERGEEELKAADRGAKFLLEAYPAGLPEADDEELEEYISRDNDVKEAMDIIVEND